MTNFQKLIATFRQNQKYQIAVFIALLFLGWFYWFQVKPIQIRSACTSVAKEMANKKLLHTHSMVIRMYPIVKQVQELVDQGRDEEAQQILDDMTDEEYKAYKEAKKLEEVNKVLFMKDDFDFYFNFCLHEKGLK